MKTLETSTSVTIDASAAKVWTAITSPLLIKSIFLGTNVKAEWKEGGVITYEGEYKGKTYKDKGTIIKFEPGKVFQSTYWSSMGGKVDMPENYNLVTYELKENDGKTIVTLTQDNIDSEEEKKHVTENWNSVLKSLKEVVETA